MVLRIESNCLGEEVDSFVVSLGGKGLVSLVFESVYLAND